MGQVSLQCQHDFYAGIVQCQEKGTDSHLSSGSSIVFLPLHSSSLWEQRLGGLLDERPNFLELVVPTIYPLPLISVINLPLSLCS